MDVEYQNPLKLTPRLSSTMPMVASDCRNGNGNDTETGEIRYDFDIELERLG